MNNWLPKFFVDVFSRGEGKINCGQGQTVPVALFSSVSVRRGGRDSQQFTAAATNRQYRLTPVRLRRPLANVAKLKRLGRTWYTEESKYTAHAAIKTIL